MMAHGGKPTHGPLHHYHHRVDLATKPTKYGNVFVYMPDVKHHVRLIRF